MIKLRSAIATISTNLFLILGMTPNYANTITNMKKGCQEIPLQSEDSRFTIKDICNSRKLSKVAAIYKIN